MREPELRLRVRDVCTRHVDSCIVLPRLCECDFILLFQLIASRARVVVKRTRHVARFDKLLRSLQILLSKFKGDPRRGDVRDPIGIERLIGTQPDLLFRLANCGFGLFKLRGRLCDTQFQLGIVETHEHLATPNIAADVDADCDDLA